MATLVTGRSAAQGYDHVQIALHWLTAALVVLAIGFIWAAGLAKGPLHDTLFFIHRSFGMTIFVVTAFRLAWRATHPVPPPPDTIPPWQRFAATATHWLLYALLIGMPITGFVSSAARGHAVTWFFLLDVPRLPQNKPLAELAETIHATFQWVVYGFVTLHAGAALRHHFVIRDGVLRRMLAWR